MTSYASQMKNRLRIKVPSMQDCATQLKILYNLPIMKD
jgi:hypothetical protein